MFGYGLEINGNKFRVFTEILQKYWGAKYNRACVGLHLVIVKRTDNELNDNELEAPLRVMLEIKMIEWLLIDLINIKNQI